jgi:L-ribulose-5-phosphate 4-epimerase
MKHFYFIIILILFFIRCQTNPELLIEDKNYKDRLIEIGKRCYDRELFWGTGGDISVRIPDTDRFIIKGTGNCVGDLEYDRISTVNLDNKKLSGPDPSHETPIHTEIYKMRDDVGAILHMHAPYATAWATVGEKVPAITQQSVSLLKNSGIIPYYPVGSSELIESVVKWYRNREIKVVFMENHGVFVVAQDLPNLLYNAELVENTARIAYFCKALGTVKPFEFQSY